VADPATFPMPATSDTPTRVLEPIAVRPEEAARLCSLSRPTWDRAEAAGRTPAAIRLGDGGAKLFGLDELRMWVAHGCPDRVTWTARWKAILLGRTK
jgi:hypothetical protein